MPWIKAIISLGLLFFLLCSLSWGQIFSSLVEASLKWVAYALIAGFGHFWVAAWRWQLLLKSLDVQPLSLPTLAQVYLMGGFFNNFAPANLGGDAARIAALLSRGRNGAAITTSVILERILNLVGLCALCIWAFFAQPLPLSNQITPELGWWGGAVGIGILSILIALSFWPPPIIRAWISKMHEMSKIVWRHPSELAQAMIATLFLHFVLMLITFNNSRAVSIFLPLDIHLAVYAIAGIATALPITIQGIGIREGIYLGLFGTLGIAPEGVLAALALNYIVLIMFSFLGGILVFAAPRCSSRRME
jgi:uncharacterized membrane protein YbhN (UPF0104 family)